MALNNENNYLKILSENAFDAHQNLYIAEFTGGELNNSHEALMVRCDGFTQPSTSQDSYPVSFMNQEIQRPKAKVEVTRNFTVNFRVDANYTTFKALLKQQNVTFDPSKSFTSTHIPGNSFEVSIKAAIGGLQNDAPSFKELFHFKDCWISKITPLKYDSGDSSPLSVSVTINYVQLQDLHSGF